MRFFLENTWELGFAEKLQDNSARQIVLPSSRLVAIPDYIGWAIYWYVFKNAIKWAYTDIFY